MFDLDSYLDEKRKMIDAALDREMPPEAEKPAALHKAMRYCVFSGGKRLRPILCLAAAEAVGANAESAILPAAAVELFHTYTLIHDDLPCMDDDDFRRGKPSCHKVFGEAGAVLAGDALQALAFEVLGKAGAPPYAANQLVLELARAAGSRGVVGGQVEDLAAAGAKPGAADFDYIHEHKTADLFRAACRMGAIAGGASRGELDALAAFGAGLGTAFQITDDILDSSAGKKRDKTSCLSVYTPSAARQKAQRLVDHAVSSVRGLRNADRAEPLAAMARFILARVQ